MAPEEMQALREGDDALRVSMDQWLAEARHRIEAALVEQSLAGDSQATRFFLERRHTSYHPDTNTVAPDLEAAAANVDEAEDVPFDFL